MLMLSRLSRFIFYDALPWIYGLLTPWISHAYHSLSNANQWESTTFSASLIQSIIAIMHALWGRIILALAALLVIWVIWRSLMQLIAGIGAKWAELYKIVMASYLWTRSLGSTTVQRPKQHSQRAIKSESQGSSAHSFPSKDFLLLVLIGLVLLISLLPISMYTFAEFDAWWWACLNRKCAIR